MKHHQITFVITTFNRRHCILTPLNSIIRSKIDAKIIVIDDASTDDTFSVVNHWIVENDLHHIVRYYRIPFNVGVTSAKNYGYFKAQSDWVAFLDSDDSVISSSGNRFLAILKNNPEVPIIFFRCVDEKGNKVGQQFTHDRYLSTYDYVNHSSFGEALTVINKSKVKFDFCYPGSLRGYEGLGCCKLIREHGPALLANLYFRIYDMSGSDRLQTASGMFNYLPYLIDGHRRFLRFHREYIQPMKLVIFRLKVFVYWILCKGKICYDIIFKSSRR